MAWRPSGFPIIICLSITLIGLLGLTRKHIRIIEKLELVLSCFGKNIQLNNNTSWWYFKVFVLVFIVWLLIKLFSMTSITRNDKSLGAQVQKPHTFYSIWIYLHEVRPPCYSPFDHICRTYPFVIFLSIKWMPKGLSFLPSHLHRTSISYGLVLPLNVCFVCSRTYVFKMLWVEWA